MHLLVALAVYGAEERQLGGGSFHSNGLNAEVDLVAFGDFSLVRFLYFPVYELWTWPHVHRVNRRGYGVVA